MQRLLAAIVILLLIIVALVWADGLYHFTSFSPSTSLPTATSTPASATSTSDGTIVPVASGVRGTVMIGPTCPVERDPPDPNCADKPYATSIAVYRTGSDTPLLIGASDRAGNFKFDLPPAPYILKTSSGTVMPSCARADVTVLPSAYATALILCDSGIR